MLAIIGSLLLGLAVIFGLVSNKEMNGCFGAFLMIILLVLLAAMVLGALIFTTGY